MTLATMSANEWDRARKLLHEEEVLAIAAEAREIVRELFGDVRSPGTTSLLKYAREREAVRLSRQELEMFVRDLADLMAP
jgi:hypothetical protein